MRFKKVYLEITNVCNLNCSFCPGTGRARRTMSAAEFDVLTSKLRPYTDYLYLHLMGEPLMHPQLSTLLGCAGEKGFRVIVTTNGTLLSARGDTLLNAECVHKVNISLQSFEANEGGALETYINACAAFAQKAGRRGKLCVLRLWNQNGLDKLNGDIERLLKKSFTEPWKPARGSLAIGERVWLEPGEKFDWPELTAAEGDGRIFCYGLRDQLGVLSDGTVVPCCLDHDGELALGNLFESTVEEILASARARAIYDGFSNRHAAEELCRRCGYARRFS